MSKFLFNNKAFPIISSEAEVVEYLSQEHVRAVALRESKAISIIQEIQAGGADLRATPEIMAGFMPDESGKRVKYPGKTPYDSPLTVSDVLAEAQDAGIQLQPGIAERLTERMNTLRHIVTKAYQQMSGDTQSPIIGHILMVPKGLFPRAGMPHVDDVPITGHFSSAPLDILNEEPDNVLWDALNKTLRSALPPDQQEQVLRWLNDNTGEWQDNYSYSSPGDFLIMKGQKGRNLRDTFHQKQVCVHKSTALLSLLGQIGFVCYPKVQHSELGIH